MVTRLFDLFQFAVKTNLENTGQSLTEMEKLAHHIKRCGRVGIYPCGRYTRKFYAYLEEKHPELLETIVAVYDKSTNVNFRDDVDVRLLESVSSDKLDSLIVTASKYPDELVRDVVDAGYGTDNLIVSSMFTEQLSHMTADELTNRVKQVLDLLSDGKSRTSYLLTWISMVLLDRDILSVYHQHSDHRFNSEGVISYNGLTLRHVNDRTIQHSLAMETYKIPEVAPEKNDVVVDVGAYRGDTAAFFSKYVGEQGRIYAFEPDEKNYGFLVDNIASNAMNNVIPVNLALLDTSRTCQMISTPDSGSFLYVMKDKADTDNVNNVRAVTLDEYCRQEKIERVNLIKSDIEGCERELLKGAEQTIRHHKPKLVLAIYHSLNDLLTLPLQVHELNDAYEIYIRHLNFADNPWEILLFAKQKKGSYASTHAATDAA